MDQLPDEHWEQVIREIATRAQRHYDANRPPWRITRLWRRIVDRSFMLIALTGNLIDIGFNAASRRLRKRSR